MGQFASVADMQVPLAFGTQTAGSVIRPKDIAELLATSQLLELIIERG